MPNEHRVERSNDAKRRGKHGATSGKAISSAGFSLVELMIVLAIVLVVTAFAIPTLTTTIDGVNLRGALGNATTIAQRCRTQAIKRNTYQRLHFATVGNQVALFVTDGTDAAVAPLRTDPT